MDAIVLADSQGVLYRAQGTHSFKPGEHGVQSVGSFHPAESPPASREVIIENISGRFDAPLDATPFASVLQRGRKCFGYHKELLHAEGTLYLYGGNPCSVHFKGCQGMVALEGIATSLALPTSAAKVHMGVFSARMGMLVNTSHCSYFEAMVARRFRSIRVVGRMFDMNLMVRLRVQRFNAVDMPGLDAEPSLTPSSIDITVSGRGTVLLRFSWAGCVWTRATEAQVVAFCEGLVETFRSCC